MFTALAPSTLLRAEQHSLLITASMVVGTCRKMQGSTGENLLQLLEMRLDSVVFRLGMAPTMSAARQVVSHGHITINGRCASRPKLSAIQPCFFALTAARINCSQVSWGMHLLLNQHSNL